MVDLDPTQLGAWLAQSTAKVNSVKEMTAKMLTLYIYSCSLYIYSCSQSLLLNLVVAVERCGHCLLRPALHACVARK